MPAAQKIQSVIVKRYAQSRLYDTTDGRYVSIEQLKRWAVEGVPFVVIDNETGEDVTHVLIA